MVSTRGSKVVARATARTTSRTTSRTTKREEPLPELNPWREVGWIFKDGEGVAIERQDDEVRAREVES